MLNPQLPPVVGQPTSGDVQGRPNPLLGRFHETFLILICFVPFLCLSNTTGCQFTYRQRDHHFLASDGPISSKDVGGNRADYGNPYQRRFFLMWGVVSSTSFSFKLSDTLHPTQTSLLLWSTPGTGVVPPDFLE